MNKIEAFIKEREKLNSQVLNFSKKNIKRFFNLDTNVYKDGELMQPEKELMGLSASMVLRCDDCISYHLRQCFSTGITDSELEEVFSIALIVGGSIVIPHLRRAVDFWSSLQTKAKNDFERATTYPKLKEVVQKISASKGFKKQKLRRIAVLLDRYIPHFNWSGFYLANDAEKNLYLGPYVGASTEHKVIPYGEGICGQAADTHESFIVDDVNKEDNYLACSIYVKSELVVPIMKDDKFLGEIDIDSNEKEAFSHTDKLFLEDIAEIIADFV